MEVGVCELWRQVVDEEVGPLRPLVGLEGAGGVGGGGGGGGGGAAVQFLAQVGRAFVERYTKSQNIPLCLVLHFPMNSVCF